MRRILSLIMVLCLSLLTIPTTVQAADGAQEEIPTISSYNELLAYSSSNPSQKEFYVNGQIAITSTVILSDYTFYRANGYDGAIFFVGLSYGQSGSSIGDLTLEHVTIDGRGSDQTGCSIISVSNGATLTLSKSVIKNNVNPGTNETDCGAVYVASATLKLIDSEISGNSGYQGGAIYNYLGTVTMQGSKISGNTASSHGGAIFNNCGSVIIESGSISGNISSAQGGAIYNCSSATVVMNGGSITGNQAAYYGGINNYKSTFTMNGGELHSNVGTQSAGDIMNNGTMTLCDISGGQWVREDGKQASTGWTGWMYVNGSFRSAASYIPPENDTTMCVLRAAFACQHIIKETIPGKAPTCEENGLTVGEKCADCGKILIEQEEIPMVDHSWDSGKITTSATETEPGIKTYTCTVCGQTKTETIPVSEHIWSSEWSADETYHWHTCSGCDEVNDKAEHTWDSGETTTPATETEPGIKTYTCTVCDQTKTEEIPAFGPGFDYEAWYLTMMQLHSQKFNVFAAAGEGGSITNKGNTKVKYSNSITYTITPDEGYEIKAVYVNGRNVGAVDEYTFRGVKADQRIEATFVKTAWENPYTDVEENAWYYEDIEFVSENELMIGTSADGTKFSPDAIVNRAMLVTVLWRLEGSPIADSPVDFTDVPTDEWYTDAVNWAAANGIVNGYGDGVFGAINDLTHEQVMAILNRYAVYKNWSENVSGNADNSHVNSEWAENNVLWAEQNGMLDGIGSDISNLTEGADRAELAAYLRRFCEKFMAE